MPSTLSISAATLSNLPSSNTASFAVDASGAGGRSFSDVLKATTGQSTPADSGSSENSTQAANSSAQANTATESTDSEPPAQENVTASATDSAEKDDAPLATASAHDDHTTADAKPTAKSAQTDANPSEKTTAADSAAQEDSALGTSGDTNLLEHLAADRIEAPASQSSPASTKASKTKSADASKTPKNKRSDGAVDASGVTGVGATGVTASPVVKSTAIVSASKDSLSEQDSSSDDDARAAAALRQGPADDKGSGQSTLAVEQPEGSGKTQSAESKTKPGAHSASPDPSDQSNSAATVAGAVRIVSGTVKSSDHAASADDDSASHSAAAAIGDAQGSATAAKNQAAPSAAPTPLPRPSAADFAAANHAQIVRSVHAQLLPNGGSIQLRLDPPDLGTMQVTVQMKDGQMTAEFQASSEQAAKLLSHGLGDLKTQLESQGVTVEKLHVSSAPLEAKSSDGKEGDSRQNRDQSPSEEQQREQQRKEMIRRMWARLSKGAEPLDMVA